MNLLTIDVEDWHSIIQRKITGIQPPVSPYLSRQLDIVLEFLEVHETKATFFILGMVAEQKPELVRRIAAQGHEIASHGYSHIVIYKQSPELFREETRRSKLILEDITGKAVRGYRAAEFSVVRSTMWALEILAELGFQYDSSIFPIRHRRYGIPDFPVEVFSYDLSPGLSIIEIPLSCMSLGRMRLPFSGGGSFRLLPINVILGQTKKLNNENKSVVFYFHPYEFDSEFLQSFDLFRPNNFKQRLKGIRYNFHQNLKRSGTKNKLSDILKIIKCYSCGEYLKINIIKSSKLIIS